MSIPRIDPTSDTWEVVKTHADSRITALRETIENPMTLDQARRDAVMRLDEIRQVLKLTEPIKKMPLTTPVQY